MNWAKGGKQLRIVKHPILDYKKGPLVSFTYDGRPLQGYEGEPIAASLHAAGIKTLSHSQVAKRPRGLFCAIGTCSSCLMTVNDIPNVRICVEKLVAGMRVETQQGKGVLR